MDPFKIQSSVSAGLRPTSQALFRDRQSADTEGNTDGGNDKTNPHHLEHLSVNILSIQILISQLVDYYLAPQKGEEVVTGVIHHNDLDNHSCHIIIMFRSRCAVWYIYGYPLEIIPDALRATKSRDSSFECKFSTPTFPSLAASLTHRTPAVDGHAS